VTGGDDSDAEIGRRNRFATPKRRRHIPYNMPLGLSSTAAVLGGGVCLGETGRTVLCDRGERRGVLKGMGLWSRSHTPSPSIRTRPRRKQAPPRHPRRR
jgi:hypothetical protein